MSDSDEMGGRSLQKFLEVWNKHPLSVEWTP
jgi:hypothetical protein